MALPKVKGKSGMQGHNTARWNKRAIVKESAKKIRRREGKRQCGV